MTAAARPQVQWRPDGHVSVRTGKVEIGQGIHTALAQIVADALKRPLADIHFEPVDTDHSPDEGVTSGSLSVQQAGAALRAACAELVGAPAAAADHPVMPHAPTPAAPHWVGQSVPRADLAAKLHGAAFIHDWTPTDAPLLHGRVLHPPQLGARLLALDDSSVRQAAGVVCVRRSGNLLGVVAGSAAQADAACKLLAAAARWQLPAGPDGGVVATAAAAAAERSEEADNLQHLPCSTRVVAAWGTPAAHTGAAIGQRTLFARYTKPWIAHASIGPACALSLWAGGRLWVDSHSQGIFNLRRDLALAFALDEAAVCVRHRDGAGCYGHNGADDVAFDAAWLAQAVPGQRVRVLWSRSDELNHAPFGPAMVVELQATLTADGAISHWQHSLWSPGHSRRPGRAPTPALLGAWQVEGAPPPLMSIDMPLAVGGGADRNAVPGYSVPNVQVHCHSVHTQRRSSALRSLGAFGNVFAAESFIDEMAAASGQCPLALRRRHLQHDPRGLAVLNAVAARAGWAQQRQASDCGNGLAMARYKGTGAWCAVVAQVQAGATLVVQKLTIAADLGLVVNPDGAANQLEGGAIQATSWVLKEAARPVLSGWADYPILRFTEVPLVDVLLMPSTAPSLGAGEASMGPTAAAIANALYDALGVRARDLPLSPQHIVAAMERPPLSTTSRFFQEG